MLGGASTRLGRVARKGTPAAGRGARFAALVVIAAWAPLALTAEAQLDHDELAPPGHELVGFRFTPVFTVENFYDDNIFATEDGREDDYFVSMVPSLGAESTWSRHYLSVNGVGRIDRYADVTSEDGEQYQLDAVGRLDLMAENSLGAEFSQGRQTVGRANAENSGRSGPQQLDRYEGALRYDHEFARTDLALSGFVRRLDFIESLDSDRDRLIVGAAPRLSYRFSPSFSLFLEPEAVRRGYDQTLDDDGVKRSSSTYNGLVGARFDITSVIEGELAAGVAHADFDESTFDDVTTAAVSAEVTWDVTKLTTLEFEVTRRLAPTTLDGASSKVQTLAGINVRHELLRNLLITTEITYFREEFEKLGRTDDNFRIRASADYEINDFLSLLLTYRFRARDTDASDRNFYRNIVMLGLTTRL
jgi:hypothetical protein